MPITMKRSTNAKLRWNDLVSGDSGHPPTTSCLGKKVFI